MPKIAVNLDQWADGPAPDKPVSSGSAADTWQNGNLGSSQAHYTEGESVPYRAVFTGAKEGTIYAVTIQWDTTQQGKHALDYLTSYNASFNTGRNETLPNPTNGVTLSSGTQTSFDIPVDPKVKAGPDGTPNTSDDISQIAGQFQLFGGSFSDLHYVTSFGADGKPGGTGANADSFASPGQEYALTGTYAGNSSTSITLEFTWVGDGDLTLGETGNFVLAWGGHIATRVDWGLGMSAAAISGSPYHMRLTKFLDSDPSTSESVGNQDRSLSSAAVMYPASITVTKQATPDTTQTFNFEMTRPDNTVDVIGGQLDISGDGKIDGSDDGRFIDTSNVTWTVTDGNVSSPSPSATKLDGYTVSGGQLDINGSGTITVDDKYTNLLGKATVTFPLGDGQSKTFGGLTDFSATAYTVKEVNLPSDWQLSGISTSHTDINNVTTTGTGTNGGSFSVSEADVWNLTFNNTSVAKASFNIVKDVSSVTDGRDADTTTVADGAGDVINYAITVQNTGNASLTGVSVTDPFADSGSIVRGTDVVGNNDNVLDVGETWSYTAAHTVTQAEIDAGGNYDSNSDGKNDSLRNVATAHSNQTPDDTDDAVAPVTLKPAIDVTKTNGGIVDLDSNGPDAGDQIVYSYSVKNTGKVTLLNVSLSDDKLGAITLSGLTDQDGDGTADDLAVGATVTGSATATLTQAQVDAGSLTNIATGTGTGAGQTATDFDTNTVPIPQGTPTLTLVKSVSVDGGSNYLDANTAPGPTLLSGTNPVFKYEVTNNSSVTLHGVTVLDDNGTAATGDDFTVFLDKTTLAPGETATGTYKGTFTSGLYTNIGTAQGTTPSGATITDTDPANYTGFAPITVSGNPQFNFPNSLIQIQPKLQNNADKFIINPNGAIFWDFYTPDASLARIDSASGTTAYGGLKVSIMEVWNSNAIGSTSSGSQAIYRAYVANESNASVSMDNSHDVVDYTIIGTSQDKGIIDLVNADPLIGNFNNFSNIENAVDKPSNNFALIGDGAASPDVFTSTSAVAQKIWASTSLTGTASGEDSATYSDPVAGGNDAVYGRNSATGKTDTLSGGNGNDLIEGRDGVNVINGGAGNDMLFGSLGNDTINGGDGDDVLFGSYGINSLTGGAGNDVFVVRKDSLAYIQDFDPNHDQIRVWVDTLDNTAATGHSIAYDGASGILTVDGSPVAQVGMSSHPASIGLATSGNVNLAAGHGIFVT